MDKNARKASIVNSEGSADRRQSSYKNTGPRKSTHQGGRRQSVAMSRKSSQDLVYPPKIRLQNTYRIAPEEDEKFKPYKIEPRMYEILENSLRDRVYDHSKTERLTKDLTQEIMRATRGEKVSSRYKIVSHVAIGQMNGKFEKEVFKLKFRRRFYIFNFFL